MYIQHCYVGVAVSSDAFCGHDESAAVENPSEWVLEGKLDYDQGFN